MIAQNRLGRYPSIMSHTMRLKAVQTVLRKQKLPCLLVTTPSNVRYLTGLAASEALVFIRQRDATLFVDARYIEAARRLKTSMLKVADRKGIENALLATRTCGYEEHDVTAGRLRRWKAAFKNTKFVHISGLVEGLRRKKDDEEIKRIKRALRITNDVLKQVPTMLRVGMTEADLSTSLLLACLERGADGMAFETIVAFGPSSSEPHHHSGARKLRARDIVQIDMGARYDGYCSDRSDVYFMGEPNAEERAVHDAVFEAKRAAEKLVRAGALCADLDREARRVLKMRKLEKYFTHSLGHGLGLDIHEGVSVSSRSTDSLLPGEVITIEPGVYLPGKFGIRLENTVFVK
jgi:Xaa-Pro aminopeptidase